MASIRPGPNGHPGGPPPPPQSYGGLPPQQQRSNGYPMGGSMPPNAPPGGASPSYPSPATLKQLSDANVATWLDIGRLAEGVEDYDRAKTAYEMAIKNNHDSIPAKKAIALLYKDKLKSLDKAIEYLQSCLHSDNTGPGDIWALLGHCFLMTGELPRAYGAYQQGLGSMSNAQDPDVWYGIGLLYDRYASFDHAEEAFSNVLYIDPNHRKRNEIYFRLGIIYKQQKKLAQSIACFEYILTTPPEPLTTANIYTQIGYVHEIAGDYVKARDAFDMVLQEEPDSHKVLLQLGFIHCIPHTRIRDLDRAQYYIDRALTIEPKDAQAWYYLGRYYMQRLNYSKAYEAYQQAVYRDSRNSNFWCSIGVLYWEINQFRDALDAYTRAIRLNPYIPEIWFNLGTLYEACNNQIQDAIDAYNRAYELDNTYYQVEERLNVLKRNIETGRNEGPPPPRPSDIDPQRYEDFLQNQANQQSNAQFQTVQSQSGGQPAWGGSATPVGASAAPPPRGQPVHPPIHPQHSQYQPRRSPDQLKTAPYSHPPSGYSNGSSGYGRSAPVPPVSTKRGSSPGPPPYPYDTRPPMNEPPHQSYPRHEDLSHRPHLPPTQTYVSPRQHERELGPGGIGGSAPFPPPASRSPVSSYTSRGRSPPPPAPMSQHGPPPDVKPALDQGPPVSPGNSHNIQLAPLQSIRSPHQTNIPPVPRNDAPAYPPPSEPLPINQNRKREWESDYARGGSSRSSPHIRPEPVHSEDRREGRISPPDRHDERRPSPQQPKPHDPTPPRTRSPLVSPRTLEPVYVQPERHSPTGPQKMEIDSPNEKPERKSTSRGEEPEKMQVEEDKRPEAEAPARAMDVDEDYDKEDDKQEEK